VIRERASVRSTRAAFWLPLFFAASVAFAQPAPEAATGRTPKEAAVGSRFMAVAAHPLAVEAGYGILKRGGSATDAAVAMQLVLGLVEPQSSGIGGGGFILHYSAADGRVRAYDGRETAPAAARPERFIGLYGRPLGFMEAVLGRAVGVPGTIAVLELAHRNHGRLPWHELAAPAITLAERGFPVSPRLHALLARDRFLRRDPYAARYFYQPDGKPKPVGTILRNPDYAAVLREVAAGGAPAFYRGPGARDIVAAVQKHPVEPGNLVLADFESYAAKERAPVCGAFRSYRVCGMPPPSSGGIAVLQILGILERLPKTDYPTARHALLRRGAGCVRRPRPLRCGSRVRRRSVAGLIAWATRRAGGPGRARPFAGPGAGRSAARCADCCARWRCARLEATTRFSVVDAEGNAVATRSASSSRSATTGSCAAPAQQPAHGLRCPRSGRRRDREPGRRRKRPRS
jgi:gamma-glutamyltranspeptidase/glutathione hydrolase